MKKQFLIGICLLLTFNECVMATNSLPVVLYKIIIESANPVKEISIKYTDTNETLKIASWKEDGGSFLVECKEFNNIALITSTTSQYRMYDINKKIATSWIQLEKNTLILLSECFAKYSTKNTISGIEFLVQSFLTQPMKDERLKLRNRTNEIFFAQNNENVFLNFESVDINWSRLKSTYSVKLVEVNGFNTIWEESNYKDTFVIGKNLMQSNNNLNTVYNTFMLSVIPENCTKAFSYTFDISNLIFEQSNNCAFPIKDSISIKWKTLQKIDSIKILRNDKTFIKLTNKNITELKFEDIKNYELEPNTNYTLEITVLNKNMKQETFSINFNILYNQKEYTKINEILN